VASAIEVILVGGRAIRLHPLVCVGFNANLDGFHYVVLFMFALYHSFGI